MMKTTRCSSLSNRCRNSSQRVKRHNPPPTNMNIYRATENLRVLVVLFLLDGGEWANSNKSVRNLEMCELYCDIRISRCEIWRCANYIAMFVYDGGRYEDVRNERVESHKT